MDTPAEGSLNSKPITSDADGPVAKVLYLVDATHLADDPADTCRGVVHAFDAAGAHLTCFPTPRLAHEWAHRWASLPEIPLPIEVEDRGRGWTRQVWPNSCRLVLWPAPIFLPIRGYQTPVLSHGDSGGPR